jgi:acetoin utilization deacetylase AcuC-like enzyme
VAFKPDLILVSAGFDAHAKDAINGGFCGVLETDYVWLTRALVGVANQVCQGRLVSVLEGGYRIEGRNVSAFARSVHDHVLALAEARPDVMWDGLDVEAAKPKLVSSSSATSGTNGAIAGGSDKVMAGKWTGGFCAGC